MKVVGNNQFQKTANTILILNYLRSQKECSRSLLSKVLGFQPSTVTYIVTRLINLGLVYETVEAEKSGSGRKPILLRLNNQFGYTIGLDLQADYYLFVITDLGGDIVFSGREDYSKKTESFSKLVDSVTSKILSQIKGVYERILGMCLALPGIVDTRTSTVIDCWTHSLTNFHLPDELKEKYGFPIILENDANCCSWNKLWDAGDENTDSFIYLLTKWHKLELVPKGMPPIGIGLGLVLQGEVFRGYRNMAGEFRSIFYRDAGTGQLAIPQEELELFPEDNRITRKLIIELLRNIFFLVPILNPRIIYIGGDLREKELMIKDILENEMENEYNFIKTRFCGLKILRNSSFDAAKGAAVYSQKQLFAIPNVGGQQNNSTWYEYLKGNKEIK